MLSQEEILTKIKENKVTIRSFGVRQLFLIGSFARNEATEQSDIDFLVEFAEGRGLFDDYIGLQRFLEKLLARKIDLIKPALVREELRSSILGGRRVEAEI